MQDKLVIIRGGGDLATGVAHRLHMAGFRLLMTERAQPTVIRRTVAFANAVYEKEATVEGVTAQHIAVVEEAYEAWRSGRIPLLVEEAAKLCRELPVHGLVDATLMKKNTGISLHLAPIVIGIGPGFEAGVDVDAVVESQRGHLLGRTIYAGKAQPNTGIPGLINGVGKERLLRAPREGIFRGEVAIGEVVRAGQRVASVEGTPVTTAIDGLLRGLLADGLPVTTGDKVGDVDPRVQREFCHLISDKARAIGGGVLEALLHLENRFHTKEN